VKVILVDDSGLSRKVQSKVLRQVGIDDIIEAKNGLDALTKLREIEFGVDLVLTDWNMPGMDGMSFIAELRKEPRGKHLPVIVISSEGEEAKISQAFTVGASSYVTKPFKKEILARKIQSVRPRRPRGRRAGPRRSSRGSWRSWASPSWWASSTSPRRAASS
jgi:two-component system chemotaxis response regulator CheY